MKRVFAVVLVMAAIVAVQAGLTYAFDFHTGEVFSRTAVTALLVYSLLRSCRRRRQAA